MSINVDIMNNVGIMNEIERILSEFQDKFKDKDKSLRRITAIIEKELVEEHKEDVYTTKHVTCALTGVTCTKYYKNGKLHRDGGEPAVIWSTGDKHWYENGLSHRKDGPASDYMGGFKYYYIRGKHIRTDKSCK